MPPCTPYVDSAIGRVGVYTQATIPVAPEAYEGKGIYLSDTDRLLLCIGNGVNWVVMAEPAQTTTPALTGMSVGTGGSASNAMTYHRCDGYVDFTWKATFGSSGTTFPTAATVALPFTAAEIEMSFPAVYVDAAVARYQGLLTTNTTSVMSLSTLAATTTAVTTTTPFTWGAGDSITVSGRYRMATRYSY